MTATGFVETELLLVVVEDALRSMVSVRLFNSERKFSAETMETELLGKGQFLESNWGAMVFKSEEGGSWLDLSGSSEEIFFSDGTESMELMVKAGVVSAKKEMGEVGGRDVLVGGEGEDGDLFECLCFFLFGLEGEMEADEKSPSLLVDSRWSDTSSSALSDDREWGLRVMALALSISLILRSHL